MGQVPAKGFLPPTPYGSSQGANALNQTQAATQSPQTPLLPPSFSDPGTMQAPQATSPATSSLGKPQMDPRQYLRSLFG